MCTSLTSLCQSPRQNQTQVIPSVQAKQEIIIAAGAPRSPQILQLSGIGPRKLLSSLDIDVIEDLPGVGHNFQDQPTMFTGVTCEKTIDYSQGVQPRTNEERRRLQQVSQSFA